MASPGVPDPREEAPPPTVTDSTAHSLDDDEKRTSTTAQDRDDEVLNLARHFTAQSAVSHYSNPFESADNRLNPSSAQFNARAWARAFYNLRASSGDGYSPKIAGVSFKDLSVFGYGSATDYQQSVGNAVLKGAGLLRSVLSNQKHKIDILHGLDGLVRSGEMLCVLGPPGSGCTTLLKTIAGDTYGFQVNPSSLINYQGIPSHEMRTRFRGEAIYTAEVDAHFPMLPVADTLYFAALARTPYNLPGDIGRKVFAKHLSDVTMAMFGISHTATTKVGNDVVRGVSGGERKRVTIAEAALSYAPLQCWDNSTRGLDSANAIEFCRTLRTQSDVFGSTSCVAIYQAPESAYQLFDKVTALYEGRQIYFGRAQDAKAYFERLGFECPDRQTTADFLTSMTSHVERVVKPGYEGLVPRTPDEFAKKWKESPEREALLQEIEEYNAEHQVGGTNHQQFTSSRDIEKSKMQRNKSPFTLSYWSQTKLCMWREFQALKYDPSITIAMLVMNFFESLIISSIFYNLPNDTSSFFHRGASLFLLIVLNAFSSVLEIIALYAKRTIVEKHARYALYHPSAEALSSLILSLPYKVLNCILVNTTLYFMANLRREPGPFFFFLLITFSTMMSMSMFFRLLASLTKTIAQALAPASIILLALVLYTGFAIPINYMRGWAHWIRYLNPVAYGFESILVNEFHGRNFECVTYVPSGPGYQDVLADERVCSTVGATPGSSVVSGTAYFESAFTYSDSHRWRNFGIIVALTVFLGACQLIASEIVAAQRSKGEVLVYRRRDAHKEKAKQAQFDEERTDSAPVQTEKYNTGFDSDAVVERQTSVFHWKDVCYDIKIKGGTKRILDHVDGWVKPGTLTALMGVSGAGKTTLLDVLAKRTTIGVITGHMLVDGQQRDSSFQRKTGYVQQQDLHLHTSTVREALEFSALLRQPSHFTRKEKLDYVNQVISLLNMEDYADAVVGVPGEGLNVEQRKRLTIGVELAARPKLLLFLDEPTSGLDSQTSWSICNLMEKLTRNGQAILCTIHQPSAMLFQRFDRLLLLAAGGKPVYFGEIGPNSRTLIDYFVRNGAVDCPPDTNPAEYMLEVIGAAPGAHTDIDWPAVWRDSDDYKEVHKELDRLQDLGSSTPPGEEQDLSAYNEFAAPLATQSWLVTKRVFQQYWRSPSYIYSKAILMVGSSIFLGFSFFKNENTIQGMQNQMFGVFSLLFMVIQLITQIMPMFVTQRALYEARERQSKTYDWRAFMVSNFIVEMAWNSFLAILCYLTWYYPMALYRNAEYTDTVHSRGTLVMLFLWVTMIFASGFAHALIAALDSDESASGVGNVFFIMMYAFCGVLTAGPDSLPGFWIFMYRVNPFTYLVDGLLSTALARAPMHCAANEFVSFASPPNQTCAEYMEPYIDVMGGYLGDSTTPALNGEIEMCSYCSMNSTDQYLSGIGASYDTRWRNFGLLWVYCVVNICVAALLYWAFRVPKNKKESEEESGPKVEEKK